MKKLLLVSVLLVAAPLFASNPMNEAMNMMQKGMTKAQEKVESTVDHFAHIPAHVQTSLHEVGLVEQVIDETPYFKWSQEKLDHLAKGNIKKGQALAKDKSLKCYKCHGKTGISDEDDSPSIAGQIAAYTYKQLHDYREKLRDDSQMFKKVKGLTDQQMIDLSVFYAAQKPEDKAKSKKIPNLVAQGDKSRFLLACDSCHDPEAMKRGFQTPIIAGQKPEYFMDTMMMFKDEERTNDHFSVMGNILARLTDEEIEHLSQYYSTQPIDED